MAPRSFMWIIEACISHGPTPDFWPKGGTLSSAGGPCLSRASWSALRRLASVRSNEPGRGVTGAWCVSKSATVIGAFCRNKRASPAVAKPGNTENHVDTIIGARSAMRSPANTFWLAKSDQSQFWRSKATLVYFCAVDCEEALGQFPLSQKGG